ncbi:hypothetical protein F5Y17DRAFT_98742 [Xylariaceae sp. FL0594]|nr:hypothetical protein F5Y17DRAFT_98742 [Xylariaceae sp. FL0594]
MAAYFQSLWTSGMGKRLIRYAMKRLDYFEADALDIDKIDFALGQESHLTWQDVGVKIEKLEQLLQLPPSIEIQKAKVASLHVTVPAAFLSSPIQVVVDGVEIKLRIVPPEEQRTGRKVSHDRRKAANPPATSAEDAAVPNAIDLAQSFLEAQPAREKEKLQAALRAESQDLAESISSSEDGSEDDYGLGTGQTLSLPAFFADFLRGIVDRVELSIRGVTCHLDVEVPVEASSSTHDTVTFQISVDQVMAEGVTTARDMDRHDGSSPTSSRKEGKRYVELNKIRASLISEADVFSALSRTSSIPSSAGPTSPVAASRRQPWSRESTMMRTRSPSLGRYLADSAHLGYGQHDPLMDSEDAFNIPYEFSSPGDALEEDDSRSAPSTPRAATPRYPAPESPTAFLSNYPASSVLEPSRKPWGETQAPTARSEPELNHNDPWGTASRVSVNDSADGRESMTSSSPVDSSTNQDLMQSHLCSHEEAESMYMSAFSHATSSHMPQAMPGAWNDDTFPAEISEASNERAPVEPPATSVATFTQRDVPTEPPHFRQDRPAAVNNLQRPMDLSHQETLAETLRTPSPPPMDEENAPEGVATPKGPTRLVKELISLSSMHIWFPSKTPAGPAATSSTSPVAGLPRNRLDRSTSGNMPGAFSTHQGAQSTTSFQGFEQGIPELQSSHTSNETSNDTVNDGSLEIRLAPLEIKFDMATALLLTTVISRVMGALKEPQPNKQSKPESKPSPLPDIKLATEKISIRFLEVLAGIADMGGLTAHPAPFDVEPLLTATLENLSVEISQPQSSTVTSVDVGKFRLGYADDDIISFDQRIQMRSSVRDAFPASGADISLKIMQSSETTQCEIKTLPLLVILDLPRLDETFTWFGGLSSFLNLNSSISATAQVQAKAPQKARAVRFDAPISPDDVSASSINKVNMRIGGVRLELVGKECSLLLDTSAVKLVNREEGLGVGISKIQLAGPYSRQWTGDAPVRAVISNTRIEFLNAPKDNDLERLLELIMPSKYKFDKNDDEIMVDTLLRQRKKGSVLRVNVDDAHVTVTGIEQLQVLPTLVEDIGRLSTVAKYLPEDDRPGILTLALVRNVDVEATVNRKMGTFQASLKNVEAAHITMPSLVALGLGSVSLHRNDKEKLISSPAPANPGGQGPVVTMRMIGDDMEPIIKLRMRQLEIEYRVSTIMDLLDLDENATPQDFEASLAASVANLGEHAHTAITGTPTASPNSNEASKGKPAKVDIILHDCLVGLNPLGLPSKMVVVLADTRLEVALAQTGDANIVGHFNKASILLVDDVSASESRSPARPSRRTSSAVTPQVLGLCQRGFVDICYISSAKAVVQTGSNAADGSKWVDVEVRDDLLILETCADSTQTLITLANALAPPTPPKKEIKYRTNVMPVQDLLASISADAFGQAEGEYDFDDDFLAQALGDGNSLELEGSGLSSPLTLDSQFYDDEATDEDLVDPADSIMPDDTAAHETNDGVLLTNFSSQPVDMDEDDSLVIHDNYFSSGSVIEGTAHRWNSAKNAYDQSNDAKAQKSPLTVRVRDVHFIWNLFDGYDWNHTRDVITKAVYDLETTAWERQSKQDRVRANTDMELVEEETVIGDFLFNSIYIGIPANKDPRALAQAINDELNDNATETESVATTAMTATPSLQGGVSRGKKLRLKRSRRHKITFELKGINVDMFAFPPGSGETQSSIDVRVQDLVVFDHIPTSTWKKFATYDQDAGEREMGASMVHLEILNVKPIAELAASEIVLKATVLPLRLHVDQDALDFITRFFEFKDDTKPTHASPSDIPFIQRAEVNSIPVTLDFKPKRVDYAGLRSGHTTEFMNFVVLDQSRMVLRHTIIYGASGFDRLGKTLNDIWMPDVKRNQLPGVLAGLAPVRSLVNVGSGFKQLIEIPIREYKKDGRVVRSISKGAAAFAKTTGTELVKLGAKLAVGTQHALQGAEGMLTKPPEHHEQTGWDDSEDTESDEPKQISLYADQPTGVVQGLRGAYSSLARDLNIARDAIIAVPGEVMESGNAQGAAKAVLKRAPTIIFRPLIGSSKAIGQTLMGATNSLDPQNRRRMDEKYKRH